MDRRRRIFCALLLTSLLLVILPACTHQSDNCAISTALPDTSDINEPRLLDPEDEVRGVWIASVYNIDFPSKSDLSDAELAEELDAIVSKCVELKLNTIYFQVRGACDALYVSDIFPTSKALYSGTAGDFDPLEYLLEIAHAKDIEVHAWVNPFRAALGSQSYPAVLSKQPEDSIAKRYEELIVAYEDGRLYLDPGYPETRELIAEGVREIVSGYDVDGVIMDDYFYPYPVYVTGSYVLADFDDSDSYAKYGKDFADRGDFRRENINLTVEKLYHTVKSIDPDCKFGISPFGIWQNSDGKNNGSATTGLESYSAIYCDTLEWIKRGTVDYIAPQIAWRMEDKSASFDVLCEWWSNAVDGSGVDLIVSHVAYKYGDGEWDSPNGEMLRQVEFERQVTGYRGSIFYGFDELENNANGIADELLLLFDTDIVYCDIEK